MVRTVVAQLAGLHDSQPELQCRVRLEFCDDTDQNATLNVNTNRGRVNVTVTSDNFDKEAWRTSSRRNQVHNTSDSVTVQIASNEDYQANFGRRRGR